MKLGLLVALAVLAVVAVVGDRVAERVAAGQVASMVEERENLAQTPEVDFEGFPFLTQVLDNTFDGVRVSLAGVGARAGDDGILRVEDIEATFHDVRTSQWFSAATAESLTGRATIPFSSIDDLGQVETSYGGTNASGDGILTIRPAGADAGAGVEVGVSTTGGRSISFVGTDGATSLPVIPDRLSGPLTDVIGRPHPMTGLPSGFVVESLEVTEDGVVVELGGRDIVLAR